MVKELVVISGKGGTGKTSLAASLAILAEGAVVADCDVDAADLHLLLEPDVRERHVFRSGHEAVINPEKCNSCGVCYSLCRYDAIRRENPGVDGFDYSVDPVACEGCGVCVRFCPRGAIDFPENICGEWMISDTRSGIMVHAKLGVAAENSGKLVSVIRGEARRLAEEKGADLVIVDGPPGIGCPVIASITGATFVLMITEPTVSGYHDFERALSLVKHFKIPCGVCVNKWDLNEEVTDIIEKAATRAGALVLGRIKYDAGITTAQIKARTAVETNTPAGEDIRRLWTGLLVTISLIPQGAFPP